MPKVDDIRIKQLNPATEKGDLDEVKRIIAEHKELNIVPNSLTIAKAIISGNLELLKFFQDSFSITPNNVNTNDLNFAIKNIKSSEMFEHLFTYRGMRFGLNNETTWIVARSGNLENLKFLLSVRIPEADTGTLFEAVNSGKLDCVKFLVEDYKINDKLVITDYEEALTHAKDKKLSIIANYLQDRIYPNSENVTVKEEIKYQLVGANNKKLDECETMINKTDEVFVDARTKKIESLKQSSNSLQNELFAACKTSKSEEVKRLLDKGANPNICDTEGNTPLFYAAINVDFDSVDYLCTAGADVNLKNKNEETPLIYAYQNRHSEIPLQLLLSKDANPYLQTKSGNTLFTLAKNSRRITELGILQEWEIDNKEKVTEFKKQAGFEIPLTPSSISVQQNQEKSSAIVAKPFIASPLHTANNNTHSLSIELQKALKDGGIQEYINKRHATLEQLTDLHQSSPWVIGALRCYNIRQGIYKNYITVEQLGKLNESQASSILHKFNDNHLQSKINEFIEENNRTSKLFATLD